MLISSLSLLSCTQENKKAAEQAIRVLYVTHEPGQWHDYVGQRQAFESIAAKEEWDASILSSSYDGLLVELAKDQDFAKDYDVVIYNFWLAKADNLKAIDNIIRQTKELNVNALLIHGAMHSFWPTFSERGAKKTSASLTSVGCSHGQADSKLIAQWQAKHPEKEFPVWGDFSGVASDKHTKKSPLIVHKLIKHKAAESVTQDYQTGKTELYLTLYKTPNVIEILEGTLDTFSAPILWEKSSNEAIIMCFSLVHYTDEWKTPEFQAILIDSIEYLASTN